MGFDENLEWFIAIALACLLGGVVGLDREIRGKPAGLRTHMFVSGASAMFGVVAIAMVDLYVVRYGPDVLRADPIRVLQAVLVGIGFLGAGTIVNDRSGGRVEGLTTAGSILMAAAIGVACAAGQFVLAAATTVLAVVILVGVGALERFIARKRMDAH